MPFQAQYANKQYFINHYIVTFAPRIMHNTGSHKNGLFCVKFIYSIQILFDYTRNSDVIPEDVYALLQNMYRTNPAPLVRLLFFFGQCVTAPNRLYNFTVHANLLLYRPDEYCDIVSYQPFAGNFFMPV